MIDIKELRSSVESAEPLLLMARRDALELLDRLEAAEADALEKARATAEGWKAEHLAGNAEIEKWRSEAKTARGTIKQIKASIEFREQLLDSMKAEVTMLEERAAALSASNRVLSDQAEQLQAELKRATSMPTASEAARNVELEGCVDRLRAELDVLYSAIAAAYGYLWHVNNEAGTPNQFSPLRAAYEARKALRDLLTHEQRGEAINQVREAIFRGVEDERGFAHAEREIQTGGF